MSNTLCFGLTSRRSGGIMLTASCRVMAPTSFAWTMNACSCRRCSLFFSASFGMSTCHASLSGYHARHLGGFISAPASARILGKSSDTSLRRTDSRYLPLMLMRKVSGRGSRKAAIMAFHSSGGTTA